MSTLKKGLIGVGVVVVLVLGVMFPRGNSVANQVAQQLGASSGNEHLNTEYFYAGTSGSRVNMISTTTIACRIQNPTNATSTYEASFKVTTATTTQMVLMLGTTTNALSSAVATTGSVAISTRPITASRLGEGSYNGTDHNNVIGPNEWIFWGYTNGSGTSGVTPQASQQAGVCDFVFKVI